MTINNFVLKHFCPDCQSIIECDGDCYWETGMEKPSHYKGESHECMDNKPAEQS